MLICVTFKISYFRAAKSKQNLGVDQEKSGKSQEILIAGDPWEHC